MALISSLKKEEAAQIAKEIYEKFEKDTGKVPEWVRVMAHRPEILKEFVELFKVIMGSGKIESVLKWRIAYTVSQTLKCPFCVDVTTKMLKKFGLSDEMIEKVQDKEEQKQILVLVRDITEDGHLDHPELFKHLQEKFNPEQIVEIVSVIGLFNYINRFNNTLAILPE